jgi:hypothetical protein
MDDDYPARGSRTWLWVLLLLLIAFIGGMAAMGYAVTHDPRTAHWLRLESADQAKAEADMARHIVVAPAPPTGSASLRSDAAIADAQTSGRLATLEDKVDDIEAQAKEATGDASRAEGLLVAFAARRALDRGVELGYIEGLLRQRFGQSQQQAVAVILSAARQPVTLADLQAGLDTITPQLSAGGEPQQSWWQSVRHELAGLVVVRRVGEPSNQPADRVARAGRRLEAGQVDLALAEVVRLPDHRAAAKWILDARRYIAERMALDQIETAALLDPNVYGGPGSWPGGARGGSPVAGSADSQKTATN